MDIKKINLKNKRVFLRADLNIPIDENGILEDHRLKAILPTIDFLQKQNAKIILATHMGRPPAALTKNFFDEELSTKQLVPWFEQKGYKIDYEMDLKKAIYLSHKQFDTILLLENLRFFNGEKETNNDFATLLAQCADIYINDAFGVLHRHDTSITLLPQQFKPNERAFGLLIEKEFHELNKLKNNSASPFIIVLGGKKAETKIKVLENLIELPTDKRPTAIIIGGAIANTFLSAKRIAIGKSVVEKELISTAYHFLEQAASYGVQIILPIDVTVASTSLDDVPMEYSIDEIPQNQMIVDIGSQTIELFKKKIRTAKTIFSNGTMGIYENQFYQEGSHEILNAIAHSNAYTLIGGGDTVAAAYHFKLESFMNFLSTGGGATLVYLANKNPEQELPGIEAMLS